MSGSDIVAQFAELFAGREDAVGQDSGGCLRYDGKDPARWNGLTSLWWRHLRGEMPIGVYPLVQRSTGAFIPGCDINTLGWYVKWGCVDLDVKTDKKPSGDYTSEDECHIAAVNLQKTLKHMGVTSWIERTRSSGRHVWVFAETWVSATHMRRALLVASAVAGTSKREINPKSETLAEGSVGNYVRLPYPGGGCPLTQSIMAQDIPVFSPLGCEYFVERALAERTPIATLEHIANLYREPVRPQAGALSAEADPLLFPITLSKMNPLARTIYNKPVDQINDRSMHIEAFVRAAKDSGLSASETLTLADDLAARCGKFDGRRDREDQLRRIVERAYT